MDRSEWMYRMERMEPRYLVHVQKFVTATKAHHERLDQTTTICLCSHCKNMKGHKDSEVQSHLIRFGFVKDYTVWTFHGEKVVDTTVGDASGGNSTLSMTVNAEHVGRQPASSSQQQQATIMLVITSRWRTYSKTWLLTTMVVGMVMRTLL